METVEIFIKSIVTKLVTRPDEVTVRSREDDRGKVVYITLNQVDAGGVIGRNGMVAKSIRTLVRSVGYNIENKRCSVIFDIPE
jgi:uncharacterized protein